MLYRNIAARSLLRAISSSNASVARSPRVNQVFKAQLTTRSIRPTSPSLALATRKPIITALVRHSSSVSKDDGDIDMTAGIRAEARIIKETFSMSAVPKDALVLGFAGVIPYVATALQTVALSYEINSVAQGGEGLIFSGQSAELMLHMLEPIQVAYGAVILSFLGAIHWGLEWAGYGGKYGYKRYAAGVLAPAIAWPTLLMPFEFALITQFFAFNCLYYNDSRAATHGRAPAWYGMYRFVLTFVVGAAIVASLIGREQINEPLHASEHTLTDKINALLFLKKKEEEEEKARLTAAAEEE